MACRRLRVCARFILTRYPSFPVKTGVNSTGSISPDSAEESERERRSTSFSPKKSDVTIGKSRNRQFRRLWARDFLPPDIYAPLLMHSYCIGDEIEDVVRASRARNRCLLHFWKIDALDIYYTFQRHAKLTRRASL